MFSDRCLRVFGAAGAPASHREGHHHRAGDWLGLLLVLMAGAAGLAQAANAADESQNVKSAGWRMDGSGRYPKATPPTEWSTSKNVIWATPLPKWSNASPVLMNGLLYCCSEPSSLLCLNAADGKILWERKNDLEEVATPEQLASLKEATKKGDVLIPQTWKLGAEAKKLGEELKKTPADAELKKKLDEVNARLKELGDQINVLRPSMPPQLNADNGYTSSTPVTDGGHVYAVFASGVVAGYDIQGKRLWIRYFGTPTMHWGHAASPVLANGKLLVQINTLLALNPLTGETEWTARTNTSQGTALAVNVGDVPVLVTPGGEWVRLTDGQLLASGLTYMQYSAPIINDGTIYYVSHSGRLAVKLPAQVAEKEKPKVLWRGPGNGGARFWCSPVYHDGLVYAIESTKRKFQVIDAETGWLVYEKTVDIPGEFYASITFAGHYLYLSNEKGTTIVLEPGREWKELARNTLEPFRCTPIFDGKRMYIRGAKAMYCIGEGQ
jgi:outer membrane protein assembly factor BamB